MTVQSLLSPDRSSLTISVTGRFDFNLCAEFREAWLSAFSTSGNQDTGDCPRKIIIDLRGVTGIDSSALGMMLVLRESASKKNVPVHICNASPDVRKVLKIANYEKLFEFG